MPAPFLYENAWHAILKLQLSFVIFKQKNIDAKPACKMLMNLTTEGHGLSILGLDYSQVRKQEKNVIIKEIRLHFRLI